MHLSSSWPIIIVWMQFIAMETSSITSNHFRFDRQLLELQLLNVAGEWQDANITANDRFFASFRLHANRANLQICKSSQQVATSVHSHNFSLSNRHKNRLIASNIIPLGAFLQSNRLFAMAYQKHTNIRADATLANINLEAQFFASRRVHLFGISCYLLHLFCC